MNINFYRLPILGLMLCLTCVSSVTLASVGKQTPIDSVQSALKKLLPATNITLVTPTDMDEIYVVHAQKNIFYLHYPTLTLIFGEMLRLNEQGTPVFPTEEHIKHGVDYLVKKYLKHAIVIGKETAQNTIIEFTHPECIHCKKHHEFISTLSNVKRIVFLVPSDNDQMNKKINHILCSRSPAKAMAKIYSGGQIARTQCDGQQQRLDHLRTVARSFGVTGTPYLIVNNNKVEGFDKEKINTLLNKDL